MLPSRHLLLFTGVCMTLGTSAIAQNERIGPPTTAVQDRTIEIHPENFVDPSSPATPAAQQEGLRFNESPEFLPAGGPNVDCVCDERFNVGDRVIAAIDNPEGNSQIRIGDLGTVVCGREFGVNDLMLIRWDIDNGHDGFDACTCPTVDLPVGSETGWYVFCDTIAAVGDGPIDCVCDAEFQPGDQVRVTVDNPDGNEQLLRGDTGTVLCGREFGASDLMLVAWDITNGHDGFDACTCPTDELPTDSITGWYVFCNELALISDCPGDIDASGSVGFPDLLRVLSSWGPCVGCPEDLDDDGQVGFSDLLVVLSQWGPCP